MGVPMGVQNSLVRYVRLFKQFEIEMRSCFARREIVWAKIEAFPWWPGRVISMHMQSRELIYKILFFADTTYAYLPGKQLRPFPSGDTEGQFKNDDQQLAKAIRMAHQSYAKSQAASQQSVLSCRQEPSGGECLKQSTVFAHRQEPILQNHVEGTIAEHDEQPHQMVDQSREKFDRIRSQQTMAIQHPERESFEQITEKQVQEIVTVQNIIQVLQRRMRVEPRFGYNYADRKNSIREKMLLKEKLLEKYNLHTLIRIPPSQQSFRNQQAQVTSIHPKRKGIRRVKMCKENSQINIASLQGQCLKKLYQSVRRIFCNRIASNSLKKISVNSLKKICQVSQNQSQNFKNIFANLLRFIYRLNPSQLQSESDLIGILSGYFDRLQGDKTQEQDGSKMTQVSIPIPDFNIDH